MDADIVHTPRTLGQIILKLIDRNNMFKIKLPVLVFAIALLGVGGACKKDAEVPDLEEVGAIVTETTTGEVTGDARDRFVGSWNVSETSSKLVGTRSYSVTVEKDASFPNRVNVYNLYQLGTHSDSILANVSAILVDIITIPNQYNVDSTNYIGGKGTMSGDNSIVFNYTVDDGNGVIDTVSAAFVK